MPGKVVRYLVIGSGALVIVGLLLAAPAFACGPGTSASANPTTARAGDSVNVFGNHFLADQPVEVRWGGATGALLAARTTTGEGSFAVAITIPADASVGTHTLWVGQPVDGGRTFAFNFGVLAPVAQEPEPDPEPEPAPEPDPDPVDVTNPEPDPVDVTNPEPAPQPAPFVPDTDTPPQPAPAPAQPVTDTGSQPAPAPTQPVTSGPSPAAAPAVEGQPPAAEVNQPAATPAPQAAPAPQAPASTRSSPATSSAAPTQQVPSATEPAPERELVGAAATADAPGTFERSLFAGAGVTTSEATAPVERPVLEAESDAAPAADDPGATPVDAGGTTPWALVPLMLLAGGLLAASGAALTTELRQRTKAKVRV